MVFNYRQEIRRVARRLMGVRDGVQFWAAPDVNLVYVNNAKAGSSHIKSFLKMAQLKLLMSYGSKPFHYATDPHIQDDCLTTNLSTISGYQNRIFFSCVRNPYARALSAYLHDQKSIEKTQGEPGVSFVDFLVTTLHKRDQEDCDTHHRQQYQNLWLPDMAIEVVFFLENIAPFDGFMREIYNVKSRPKASRNATNAVDMCRQYYNQEAETLVQEIYAQDFDAFGYSRDISKVRTAPAKVLIDGAPGIENEALALFAKSATARHEKPQVRAAAKYEFLKNNNLV